MKNFDFEAKRKRLFFAVIYFRRREAIKVYGYEDGSDAAYDYPDCIKVEIYRERNDGCAADPISLYENI